MAKSFSPGTTRSRKSDGPGENGDPATPLTATLTVTHSETHTIEMDRDEKLEAEDSAKVIPREYLR